MRRRHILVSVIILILSILIFINPVSAKTGKDKKVSNTETKYSAGGHNIYLKEPNKKHSIPAHIEMSLTKKGYHEAVVHLNNSRTGITAVIIRKPFVIEDYKGFDFFIKGAVYDAKINSFVGHGEIKSTHLPGVLYASKIVFNNKEIVKVDRIRPRIFCGSGKGCNIAGFPYTAEKITWIGNGIKSKGQLNLSTFHADITIQVTKDGIKLLKLHEPVHCLIEGRTGEITKLTFKGNRFYVDGKVKIFNGKTYKFRNVLVGSNGMIRANVPTAKRPKPYPTHKQKNSFFEIPMDLISGLAGLPGEKVKKIADTNMSMIVTSADLEGSENIVSGYIPLPDPIKRVNVVVARIEGEEVTLDDAEMKWQGKKIRVPLIHSEISLETPIKLEEDEETKTKKLAAKADGILQIMEIFAPASKIYVDNYEIDYRVQPTSISGSVLNSIGSYTSAFLQVEQKVQFDVIEAKTWIGFRCDVKLGEIIFSPQSASWFSKPLIENPSFYFEIHSDGFVKIRITTGKECEIPIIPEVLVLENPGFYFLREPGLVTEFQVWGTFMPPEAGDIVKLKADFYVDASGMYLCGGTGADIYLFDTHVGTVQSAYSSAYERFTIQGSFTLFGYKFSETNCRITLKPKGQRSGQNLFKGSSGIRIPYPCDCHWVWYPPFYICDEICHYTLGIKVHIDWDGNVGIGMGTYNFKMPHGTHQALYTGPFKADGLEYDGTLIIDAEKGITATGNTKQMKAISGNNSVSSQFNLSGSWLNEEMITGNITGKINLDLKPNLPYTDGNVELTFSNLSRKFVKNPQTGIWVNVDPGKVNVQFNYDKDDQSGTFNQDCQLRMNINDSILNIDLDLPSEFGGTYSQSFVLKS